jgi:hypothetical protein
VIERGSQKEVLLGLEKEFTMCVELTSSEVQELKEILEDYHSELEMEVARTSRKEYREYLEKRDAFLEDLVRRLQSAITAIGDDSHPGLRV